MTRAGRPTKYTEERIDRLLQALRTGATLKLACQYAGISEDALAVWRRNKADLSDRMAEAEAACALHLLAVIQKAVPQDAPLALRLLERRFDGYSRSTTINFNAILDREAGRIAAERGVPKREILDELDRMIEERPG